MPMHKEKKGQELRKFDDAYYKKAYRWGYDGFLTKIGYRIRFRRAISLIKQHKTDGKLLDVGCSFGFFVKVASNRGFAAAGIDVSEFAIENAKRLHPDLKFFLMDIQKKTGFDDGEFDVITAFELLEHLENLSFALNEIKRILSGEGMLLVSVPITGIHDTRADKTHVHHLNLDEWIRVLSQFFHVEKIDFLFRRLSQLNREWCTVFIVCRKLGA